MQTVAFQFSETFILNKDCTWDFLEMSQPLCKRSYWFHL